MSLSSSSSESELSTAAELSDVKGSRDTTLCDTCDYWYCAGEERRGKFVWHGHGAFRERCIGA